MKKHDKELLSLVQKARKNKSLDEFKSWLKGFTQPGPEFSDELKTEINKLTDKGE